MESDLLLTYQRDFSEQRERSNGSVFETSPAKMDSFERSSSVRFQFFIVTEFFCRSQVQISLLNRHRLTSDVANEMLRIVSQLARPRYDPIW